MAKSDPKLEPYIDYYWLLSIEQRAMTLEVIPDTAIDLVLSPDIRDFAALYFPTDEKFNIDLEGPVQYAGICYRSETASQLFRLDFSTLTQLEVGVDTSETLKISTLMEDIQGISDITGLVDRFDRFWLSQLVQIDSKKSSSARISHEDLISVVESTIGTGSIAEICEILEVSERQFRRLSKELFGLSPKKLQRVLRLQAALDELFRSDAKQLQDLYYDDSYRIKELKRLTGCTPNQIRKMAEKYNNP